MPWSRRSRSAALMLLSAALIVGASQRGSATDVSEPSSGTQVLDTKPIEMTILQMDLLKALELLSEQAQVKITLAKGLTGQVSNLRIYGSLRTALDEISEKVGAVWWWNGSEIRMAHRADVTTRTMNIRAYDQLMATAREIGFPLELLTVTRVAGKSLRVSGPTGILGDFEALNEEVNKQLRHITIIGYGRRKSVTVD